VDGGAARDAYRAAEVEVQERPLEVAGEPREELLARKQLRAQHARHRVRGRRHHEENDRSEGEAAQERHYIKASQT
jgi:hypothetical protein